MHRSGTSAIGGWLHNGGINFGDDLLGKTQNNRKGHFEDNKILDFHRNITRSRSLHDWRFTSDKGIEWNQEEKDFLLNYVAKRNENYTQWGIKEPRICLYIDEWSEALPHADYVITFRHYSEVASSLVNREIRNYLMRYGLKINNKIIKIFSSLLKRRLYYYINVWKFYNQKILNNTPLNSNRYFCLEFKDFTDRKEHFSKWLEDCGYQFNDLDPNFVNMNLITSKKDLHEQEAETIYQSLCKLKGENTNLKRIYI